MRLRIVAIAIVALSAVGSALADETLYRYEGEVLPHDESAGWLIFQPCEMPCSEFVQDGHFVFSWETGWQPAEYAYVVSEPPAPPPKPVGRVAFPFQPSARSELFYVRRAIPHSLPNHW